jgi:hypothetical protein
MVKKGVLAALIGVVMAACGTQAAAPAKVPTPSAVATPTPVASPPPGGPVPGQLLGDWFLPGGDAAAVALNPPAGGGPPCPKPYSAANCYFQMTLAATTYHFYIGGPGQALVGAGNVVVNNDEIDVFGGANCDGVGRYKWALTGGGLLVTLISDPCGRSDVLTYQTWSRTR